MTNKKTDEGRMLCILFTLFAVPLFAILLQVDFLDFDLVPAHVKKLRGLKNAIFILKIILVYLNLYQ